MRQFLVASVLAVLAAGASGEVLRCVDAAGKVSYTDAACPAGARPERKVSTREPVRVLPDPAGDSARPAPQPARDGQPAIRPAPPPPQPAGAAIIDGRETGRTEDSRWNTERGGDPLVVADDAYPYPYAGVQHPARPPRDMRPHIRHCDATGCSDTQGNTYNRNTGQVDRYRSIDGKTCQPVGSTVVCR